MSAIVLSSTSDLFRHQVSARDFQLTVDEPSDLGGTNTGPTPTELVFSGLGACKAITMKMYAQRKRWPLAAVDAEIETEQIDKRYKITVWLQLTGELSREQREKLLAIADKCPVHKLLAPGADIQTILK
ncbi:MAG: OsmC family protein [Cyanobacteria bacterium P01_C01_bin.121]